VIPTLERPRPPASDTPSGGAGGSGPGRRFDRSEQPDGSSAAGSPAVIAVWLFVGAVILIFAAFTSTFLTRRLQDDWRVGPLPPLLWVTTGVLLASSATLEWSRSAARRSHPRVARTAVTLTAVLGAAFLTGQVVVWRELMANGVGMAASAHSAFFYLLTITHGLHVAAGVLALVYAAFKVRGVVDDAVSGVLAPVAIYWHFVDVLWLYVFAILFWL
jgi:cytochrome c oxidase subunit III